MLKVGPEYERTPFLCEALPHVRLGASVVGAHELGAVGRLLPVLPASRICRLPTRAAGRGVRLISVRQRVRKILRRRCCSGQAMTLASHVCDDEDITDTRLE